MPEERDFPISKLLTLHDGYAFTLLQAIDYLQQPGTPEAISIEKDIKTKQDQMIPLIRAMATAATLDQNRKTAETASIGAAAFRFAAGLCIVGFILSVATAMLVTRNISGAIKKLKTATEMIAEGDFEHRPDIRNRDEIGDLSAAFVAMSERLKLLEVMSIDTSPLTRLPGGVAIDKLLKQRIIEEKAIAFCLLDIDNFKAYNDRYGYAKGNELIRTAADIFKQALAEFGGPEDFLGHIGGDDFVIITDPERYRTICESIIIHFDHRIPSLYDIQDREHGYITGENRQGEKVEFDLATISIAVVSNELQTISSYIRYGEIAAELKRQAKLQPKSLYLVDRRHQQADAKKGNLILLPEPNQKQGEA